MSQMKVKNLKCGKYLCHVHILCKTVVLEIFPKLRFAFWEGCGTAHTDTGQNKIIPNNFQRMRTASNAIEFVEWFEK